MLEVILNGNPRSFPELEPGATLESLIAALALKSDRVAVEQNGEIVPRAQWAAAAVHTGDKLEVVHFVGGGIR